ncbi:MAG: Na+/H+ antiporter NhaC family protein [Planctomycetota bacterium]
MRRLVPVLIAAAVLVAAFFLPPVDPLELAALQSHEFLAWKVGPPPAAGEADRRPALWEAILAGPAARDLGDGRRELRIDGTNLPGHPAAVLAGVNRELRRSVVRGFRALAPEDLAAHGIQGLVIRDEEGIAAGGASFTLEIAAGRARIACAVDGAAGPPAAAQEPWSPPDRGAVFPPLVAVALAIALRRPLVALFAGILTGAILVRHAAAGGLATAVGGGVLDVFTRYFRHELVDRDRLLTVGFVFFMLAMVGVMTRSGGLQGLMDAIARWAWNVRRTQMAAYLMGLVVFFDDYANTILVGPTMRPLTDRFRISREKLSYIVDSTAAPVAGISVFSTWIAFEVSTFDAQLPAAGLAADQGYAVFFRTIPYSFYCLLAIFLVGWIAWSGRDLGSMLTAERRARRTGLVLRPGATPMVSERATGMTPAPGVVPRAWRAIVPVLAFLLGTFTMIFVQGVQAVRAAEPGLPLLSPRGIMEILGTGSGYAPLFWGSIAGFVAAALGAFTAGVRTDVARAAGKTIRSMGVAFAILYLAWMIGAVCGDLGTAPYLTSLVGTAIDPRLLPALVFLLAGAVAFATGSSWSTMSILMPLIVGLAYNLGTSAVGLAPTGVESGQLLMVMSIGAVLSGAIFGDHCSPISDTTVLSSIASAADHIDHVRTQMPYAMLTMAVAIVCGYLPCTYLGLSPWLACLAGIVALAGCLFVFGRRVEEAAPRG